jgi:hypothetical protein
MANLSVSAAWDESKAILSRDGKLLASVALALVALPSLVTGLVSPRSMPAEDQTIWAEILFIAAALIQLAGQLALIRLALGPSITVGGAIGHGLRRLGVYVLSGILIMLALVAAAIPFILVLAALGIPLDESVKPSGTLWVIALHYLLIVLFVGVRMIMSGPVASAEQVGPVAILRRSWLLTGGNFWRLLAFLLAFFIGAVVVLLAVGAAVGVLIGVASGKIEPMSGSALIVALVQAFLNAVITTVFAVMLARLYVQATGGNEAQASIPKSGT